MTRRTAAAAMLAAVVLVGSAAAHFNVILPAGYDQYAVGKGRTIEYRFLWGHGYEHIWFDATKPEELKAYAPDGKSVNLLDALKPSEVAAADGHKRRAFTFQYRPEQRGDHVIAMKAALLFDEDEGVFLQDYAKSVLHVQDKGGWDRVVGQKFELVPLTRPYALQPGAVVRMQVLYDGKPVPACEVEMEKLQPRIIKTDALPGEELMTFEAKSDPNGVVAFGVHEPGWFAFTAIREGKAPMERDGHSGPLVERATFWVHVAPLYAPPRG